MPGRYSLELLEQRVMLSADGLVGGLMVQDRVHDLEGVCAIEVLQDSRANASDSPACSTT